MAKKKTPSKKEAQEVLKRAEKKIQEDKLNLILEKVAKIDTIEKTLKETRKKTDKLEAVYNKTVGATNPNDKSTKKKPTNEELLAQAQAEQEKAAGQGQSGQQAGQQTPEQRALGATQQFQQDVAQAQAAQTQAQQQGQRAQPGQLLTPQGAWLLERAAHAAEVVLPAFFQSKGSNTGVPLKAFFDQLKIYQSIENTIMGGFFNFMRNLSPQQRQTTMDNIATSPPRPTMTNLPAKSEFIE